MDGALAGASRWWVKADRAACTHGVDFLLVGLTGRYAPPPLQNAAIQRPLEERGRLAILARQDALHLVVRVEINPDRGRPAETTDVTGIRPAVDEPPRRASAQGA